MKFFRTTKSDVINLEHLCQFFKLDDSIGVVYRGTSDSRYIIFENKEERNLNYNNLLKYLNLGQNEEKN